MVARNQRQEKLIDILSRESSMMVSDLSEKLNSSEMTIRRDLDYLEERGIVKRFHGGAALARIEQGQPSFYERYDEFNQEKSAIGREAANLVTKGCVVFFDAGTTPLAVIEHIPDYLEFTAITTGLLTAVSLCNNPYVNVVNIGGNIHHSSYSSVSHISVELIKRFHADIAFISTKAVCLPDGIFEAQLALIEIKQAIVNSSDRVVLVADNSKFYSRSMCKAISIEQIDLVITDDKLEDRCVEELKNLNKDYILAKV